MFARRTPRQNRGRIAAQAFLPPKIPGLVLWLRSDLGITTISGAVSQWADQSATGAVLTQGSAGARPTYNTTDAAYNGQPTLSFTFAATSGLLMTGSLAVAQPYTIIVVGENNDSTHQGGFCGSLSAVAGIIYQSSPAQDILLYSGASLTSTTIISSKCAMAGVFNGASSASYVNNSQTAAGSGNAGAVALSSAFNLGTSTGAPAALTGKIAEVLVYNSGLTASQRKQLFSYLGSRYGITVS